MSTHVVVCVAADLPCKYKIYQAVVVVGAREAG